MINLATIYDTISSYQYLIIFLVVVVEGPIATVAAGFLVAQGLANFFIVYPLVIIADLVGDIFYYSLGRWGEKFNIKSFNINSEKLKKIKHNFVNNSGKALLLGKIAHGIGSLFLFAAGITRVPFKKFLYFDTLGTLIKSLILLIIGYFFGQSYLRIGKYFDYFALFTLTIGIIILLVYLVFAKKIKKKEDL